MECQNKICHVGCQGISEFRKLCAKKKFLKYFHTTILLTAISYSFWCHCGGLTVKCAQRIGRKAKGSQFFFFFLLFTGLIEFVVCSCGVVNQRIISEWSDIRRNAGGGLIALTWLRFNWWWRRSVACLRIETNDWPAFKGWIMWQILPIKIFITKKIS